MTIAFHVAYSATHDRWRERGTETSYAPVEVIAVGPPGLNGLRKYFKNCESRG